MQRLTILAAAAGVAAFAASPPRAAAQAPISDPPTQEARALDSLRLLARQLRAREAELAARLALLHRDAMARVLDRDALMAPRPGPAPTPEEQRRAMLLRRDLFYTVLTAGIFANAMWKLDLDDHRGPRPLVDRHSGYHFTAGVTLEQLGFIMRVSSRWRVAGVCAAAELFEHTQGYVDHVDAALGCAGAAISSAARWAFAGR